MRLPLVLLAILQPAAALVVSRAALPRRDSRVARRRRLGRPGGRRCTRRSTRTRLGPKVGIHEVAYAIYGNPQGTGALRACGLAEQSQTTRGILTPIITASF